MICIDCAHDDGKTIPDEDKLSVDEIVHFCRTWKCKRCRRTPEQIQADYDAAAAKNPHKSAHDWDEILKTPTFRRLAGADF